MTDEHERQDLDDEADDDGEERPKITLDRYLSKRRNSPKSGLSHIVAMVLMLITLVLVIMYKDRCGDMVSGVMGDIDPQEKARPSVRFKIQPGPSKPTNPASQPAP
jgi:hypothetical protein